MGSLGEMNAPKLAISPAPTDEEAAAIVAATEALWPKPLVAASAPAERPLAWRFSGRWWRVGRHAPASRPWR